MPHARTLPLSSARGACALMPDRSPTMPSLAAAEAAFARHVKARRLCRANPTSGRIRATERAWEAVLDAAGAITSAPAPRSAEELRCLAVAISMTMEGGLDPEEDVAEALRTLLTGVMLTLGVAPPVGHEGL